MNVSLNPSNPNIRVPSNVQAPDTSALEKEISILTDKLKSLRSDMQRFEADRSQGALGIDEMKKELNQAYQKFSAELAQKQAELQRVRNTGNTEAVLTMQNTEPVQETSKYDSLVLGAEDPANQTDVTYHLEQDDGVKKILFNNYK